MSIFKVKDVVNKVEYKILPELYFKNRVYILLYHSISPKQHYLLNNMGDKIHLSVDDFEQQIEFISNNYNVVSISDYIENRVNNESLIITFDDGFQDNFKYAYPILNKKNIPFSICINSNFIDNKDMFWLSKINLLKKQKICGEFKIKYNYQDISIYTNNYELENNIDEFINKKIDIHKVAKQEQLYLNKSNIFEMNNKLVTILPHTHRHYKTIDLNYTERKNEIEKSINFCKKYFIDYYQPVFSFPFGTPNLTFSDKDLDIIKQNEIKFYLSANGGINHINLTDNNIKRKSVSSGQEINNFKYFIERPNILCNYFKRFKK